SPSRLLLRCAAFAARITSRFGISLHMVSLLVQHIIYFLYDGFFSPQVPSAAVPSPACTVPLVGKGLIQPTAGCCLQIVHYPLGRTGRRHDLVNMIGAD